MLFLRLPQIFVIMDIIARPCCYITPCLVLVKVDGNSIDRVIQVCTFTCPPFLKKQRKKKIVISISPSLKIFLESMVEMWQN